MNNRLTLDPGHVIWNVPEGELGRRPLLLLLHGKGSFEGDLAALMPHIDPGFDMASLRAPLADGHGFSWFPVTDPGNPPAEAVNDAADAVLGWVDRLPNRPSRLGLFGFSQGGVVAFQTLRRAPERVDFVLNLSGFVTAGDELGDTAIAQHPVLWARGDSDPVIPTNAIERTDAWLRKYVAEPDIEIYPGLGHSISMEELSDLDGWINPRRTD